MKKIVGSTLQLSASVFLIGQLQIKNMVSTYRK